MLKNLYNAAGAQSAQGPVLMIVHDTGDRAE